MTLVTFLPSSPSRLKYSYLWGMPSKMPVDAQDCEWYQSQCLFIFPIQIYLVKKFNL